MSTAQHRSGGSTLTKPDHGRVLRLDIEGMRTIAVGSVLVGHAGVPWFAGGFVGVDVFFVLSGFLITGLLAREVSRTGRVRIGNFWARRMKRLLPASATVLLFSTAVTWLYLPITQRQVFGGDIVSAALYVVNWRLADRGVDYLAEDIGESPVQHYWSLAVEEQFYLVWPLLMLAIGVIAAKRWKQASFLVLGLVTAASFVWSVQQTESTPATAYFVSTTRVWELGIGALLALAAVRVGKLPPVLLAVAGWVGLAMIAYAVLMFDESTSWPGANALVPTVGAALVIASGITRTAGSPQRLLSLPPMVWIGGLSYSIYLWHWPILIAAQAEHPDLRLRWTVLLMILSIIPSWVSHTYIENPVRFGTFFKPTGRALAMGVALTAVGVATGLLLSSPLARGGVVQEAARNDSPGARVLAGPDRAEKVWSEVKSVNRMRPLPADATADRPTFYDDGSGCQVEGGISEPKLCVSGDKDASKTMVIVGDSKMAQWQSALDVMGKREGWKVVQITKSACSFTDAAISRNDKVKTDCREWGRAALKDIIELDPDLVVASQRGTEALPEGKSRDKDRTRDAMVAGLKSYWSQIREAGIPVAVLLDNPEPSTAPVYECVAANAKNLTACAFDEAKGIARSAAPVQREAADGVDGVKIIDMTDVVCPDDGRCAAVIGNVLVYRQGTHLTRTYIDSAERQLAAALARATDGAFGRG